MLSTRWIMTRYLTPVLVVTAAGSLFAQGEPPICQTVSRAVETGVAGKPPLTALADCRESGPPSLALLWERRALAETDLPKLVEASSRLRDDRLYESVSGVARDETQGTPKRLAALQTIAAYFEQSFAPTIEYLTQSALGDPVPRMMHRRTMVGAVPLSAGSCGRTPAAWMNRSFVITPRPADTQAAPE